MATVSFEDFYKVPDLNFNISRLREDLEKILEQKKFKSPGVTHFGAIPVNQIPNDENSINGNNIRGKYWTIADDTGKEVARDIDIDESKYTQIVPEFEKTYFKEVLEALNSRFKLGRVRLLLKEPRSTLSWHKDPECRLHVPIITNKGSILRTIIYTIGHFLIAITVLMLVANVSFIIALTDAIVEPIANSIWYFILDKWWASKSKN